MKKKGLAVAVILLFIGMCVVPSTGVQEVREMSAVSFDGTHLYVGGSGEGNYTTIQDAIDDASDGDIVYVYSGFYDESLTISATIILQGEAPTTTTINGIAESVIEVAADNVTIMGFTLESLDVDEWLRGIIFGGNNTEIAYNIFQKLGYGVEENPGYHAANHSIHDNIFRNNNYGIELYSATHNMIFNNSFRDNVYGGFGLYYSNNNMIYDNSFFHDGLEIGDSYNNIVYNNTINNKPIIYLENAKNIVVEHAGQVLLFNCENITIQNCYFNDTSQGIHLCSTKHCTISKNIFTNTTGVGCYMDYTRNTFIQENFFNSIYCGIIGWQCINTIIKYNNFTNCQLGLGFEYGALITRIIRNNFINNTRDIVFLFSCFFIVRQNYWNEPRIIPKIIHVGVEDINPNRILIDWNPAQEPYDLGV